jgi:lipopolysaccharide/colanic/teichoic acid biosynthesis glycosyltransferase
MLSSTSCPQVLNVLGGGDEASSGPRPLPLRDYRQLEAWHRKRYHVPAPGSPASGRSRGRSNLTFDDLVRLDFYYIENWSICLTISILFQDDAVRCVFPRRGAY